MKTLRLFSLLVLAALFLSCGGSSSTSQLETPADKSGEQPAVGDCATSSPSGATDGLAVVFECKLASGAIPGAPADYAAYAFRVSGLDLNSLSTDASFADLSRLPKGTALARLGPGSFAVLLPPNAELGAYVVAVQAPDGRRAEAAFQHVASAGSGLTPAGAGQQPGTSVPAQAASPIAAGAVSPASCSSNPAPPPSGPGLTLAFYCRIEPGEDPRLAPGVPYVFRLTGVDTQVITGQQLCRSLRAPAGSRGCAYIQGNLVVIMDPAAPSGSYTVNLALPDGRQAEAAFQHVASASSGPVPPSPGAAAAPASAAGPPAAGPAERAQAAQPAAGLGSVRAVIRRAFDGPPSARDSWHPDDTIAAGPYSLLIVANHTITLRDKAGASITSTSVQTFFTTVMHQNEGVGDPWIAFDPTSERFFYVADGTVGNGHTTNCQPGQCVAHHLLAVSKSSNPRTLGAADWYFYALDMTTYRTADGVVQTANWGDFDSLAIGADAVLIKWPAYLFGAASESRDQSQGVKLRILDKSKLISGQPVTEWTDIELKDPQSGRMWTSSIEPAMGSGLEGPFLLVGSQGCLLTVFAIETGPSAPAVTTRTVSLRQQCSGSTPAPQPDSGAAIDVVTYGHSLTYRSGNVWYAFAGGGGVRFFQINVSDWPARISLVQDGTLGDPGVTYMGPALMVDGGGNVAIVTARSGLNEYPSLYYTWHPSNDPSSTLRPAELLKAGTAKWEAFSQATGARNRYIDFLGAAFDPVDGSIWLLGPYVSAPGVRATWVTNITFEATSAP